MSEKYNLIRELLETSRIEGDDDVADLILDELRRSVESEILYSELSVVKLIRILKEISDGDEKDGRMLLSLLAYPLEGLRIHAHASGMSKATVFRHVHRIARSYPEIRTLLRLRKSLLKPAPERGSA